MSSAVSKAVKKIAASCYGLILIIIFVSFLTTTWSAHRSIAIDKYLPEAKGLSKDWSQPLFSEIYETTGPCE